MAKAREPENFVVCLNADDYAASLEPRKLYRTVADAKAAARGLIRVVDESGEDYLYPSARFAAVALPKSVRDALAVAG